MLVSYLKDDTSKFESGLGHGRLLLAATDCVWCSVIGNPLVEDIFLENEGAFVLLDLLKVLLLNFRGTGIFMIFIPGLSCQYEEFSSRSFGRSL